jgi:DNA-binding NarL/FixJ family response regulator
VRTDHSTNHRGSCLVLVETSPAPTEIPSVRILLADDHEIVRRGLRALLEERPGWQVCSEVSTGHEAVQAAIELRPDVIVLDLTLPDLSGLEATRQILSGYEEAEILIFTMHEGEQIIRDVLIAGARGYVLKSDAGRFLVNAVEALADHHPYFSGSVAATVLGGFVGNGRAETVTARALTGREREIVQLLAEGKNNKEIASRLSLSVKTVESHRSAVMHKLGLKSFADLVRYAIRNGLIGA